MAICIVIAYFIIDGNSISSFVTSEQTPKTNKIETSLLEPIKLFIVLKNIYNTKLALMPEILVIIIE